MSLAKIASTNSIELPKLVTIVASRIWIIRLLTGTKCPHPRPNLGHPYRTLTQQEYARLNLGSICTASTRVLLTLSHGCSSSELTASSCSCSCSVSLTVPIVGPPRHLRSHPICDEKMSSLCDPIWRSQFGTFTRRTPGGDESPLAAC